MIGKLFHLAHLVDDLEATDRLYDDVFDCERYYHGYERPARRTASLLVVADQCMEPIQPSADPDDAGWPLQRFKSRFGNRLHSIAWYVDDIHEFTQRMLDHDIRLVGLTGKPVTDAADATAIWTHPGDTGALLEFCEAGFAADPRLADDFDPRRWRDHPLGLTHTSHVTVLFDDLDDADRVYGDVLGGEKLRTADSDPTRPRAYYTIGTDTVIDAVAPTTDDTAEGADHASAGNAVHAITFATTHLGKALEFLATRGISTTPEGERQVWLDLDPGHGIRMGLTDEPIVPAG